MEAMTVGELIQELQSYDKDMPVVSCVSYDERSGVMEVIPAIELNKMFISESVHSVTGYKAVEDGEQGKDDQGVLVLNSDHP